MVFAWAGAGKCCPLQRRVFGDDGWHSLVFTHSVLHVCLDSSMELVACHRDKLDMTFVKPGKSKVLCFALGKLQILSLVIFGHISSPFFNNRFPGLMNVFIALRFWPQFSLTYSHIWKSESCRNADLFKKLYPLITFSFLKWSLTPSHLCKIC